MGSVYLVGAGPGDPGLCTVRGLALIREADVIVHDYLASSRLLSRADPTARLIFVGKRTGEHTVTQEEINRLLVELADEYDIVVRLKGGDPFVFGRGGEEALELERAGTHFEVVPGVSSGIAAPAYAGIPLTHRGVASAALLVSGHLDPTETTESLDWVAMAPTEATLVFYMGVRNARKIADLLIESGRAAATPAAMVRWGTTADQSTIVARLDEIADRVEDAGVEPPAILVVGNVVELRQRLQWFDSLPLFGRKIVVTRSRDQRSDLSLRLELLGAQVTEIPTIEIRPPLSYEELDESVRQIDSYDWVVFTSQKAVASLFDRLGAVELDARSLSRAKCAVVGSATAATLKSHGIRADLQPRRESSEGLLETFDSLGVVLENLRILFPCSDISRRLLSDGLAARGATVDRRVAYRTVSPKEIPHALRDLDERLDLVTFTSSSTVRNLVDLLDRAGKRNLRAVIRAASIGPVTTQSARELGIQVVVEPKTSSIAALASAIRDYFQGQ